MKGLFSAHSIVLPSGAPPEWVHLMPLGVSFQGRDGRGPYSLPDVQAAQSVIAATLAYQSGADIPIDYDHQLLWSRQNGQPAPASGWIKEFQARADGIWGRVEWTPRAAELLRDKEYRYLSPVFMHDQAGSVTRLAFAALSNIPNLELAALASQLPGGEPPVLKLEDFLKQLAGVFKLSAGSTAEAVAAHAQKLVDALAGLAKAVGLPDNSTMEQLTAHAQKLAGGMAGLARAMGLPATATVEQLAEHAQKLMGGMANLAKAMGQPEGSTMEQLAAHAQAMAKPGEQLAGGPPDPSQYVPMSQFNLVNDRLKKIEGERVAGLVEEAIKGGKIPPANRDWAMTYASQDEAGFKKMLEGMPAILAPGQSGPAGAPPGKDGLSAEDMAICSQLGLPVEEFKKTRISEKEGQ